MDEYRKENKDYYNFKIFSVLFEFYLFGKKIEKSFDEPMLSEEYYLINLKWLKDLKAKFDFKKFEDILNYHFSYDHTFKFDQNDEEDKFKQIFKRLTDKFKFPLNVTEEDFISIKKIDNSDIEKMEKNYYSQQNFAFVSPRVKECLCKHDFKIYPQPKYDIYNGNKYLVFENPSKNYNFCLECIKYDDYDKFSKEYIIIFEDQKSLEEHKNIIISKSLRYYFDENKIKPDEYIEQFIYDELNRRIATVYNLNSEKIKGNQLKLDQTLKNIIDLNKIKLKSVNQSERINNNLKINMNLNDINVNNNFQSYRLDNYGGKNFYFSEEPQQNLHTLKISQNEFATQKVDILQKYKINDNGLKNFGNSCYINAVLQCLIHIRQIVVYFFNPNYFQPDKTTLLSDYFFLLLKHFYINKDLINNNNFVNNITDDLSQFCQVVNLMNNNFSPFIPNDAKDFLIFFIGKIHEELNMKNKNQPKSTNIIKKNDPLMCFLSYFTRNYHSIISHLFNWTNQIMRTCSNCQTKILSYQTFPYLILDLEKTRKNIFISEMNQFHKSKIDDELFQREYYNSRENIPINLTDCVEYYCSYKNNFNFLCPECKNNCIQTTVNKIYTSPNIFIFILNRGKNNIFSVKMNYPPELDLTKYVETTNKSPTKYELIGVITHLGISGPNGHFIAFCKNIMDGKWYKYNDETVTEADNFNVHNEGIAYILFYNMVKTK